MAPNSNCSSNNINFSNNSQNVNGQHSLRLEPMTTTREFLMSLETEDLETNAERAIRMNMNVRNQKEKR